jgi:hypothetical protein
MIWKLLTRKRTEVKPAVGWRYLQAALRARELRLSAWLQRKAMTLPAVRLKLYAALFLLFFGSWNGWIIIQALRHPHRVIPAQQVSLSHSVLPSIRLPVDPSSLAGIGEFRSWLDSLQADSDGRRIYDSIRLQRPGLLDSLRKLEPSMNVFPLK